jgi:hypothetical protein
MKKQFLLFTVLFISIFVSDFLLSFYGRNYSFIRVHLPFGFNTDYDYLEGFKIEDEGFIQVLGKYDIINDSIKINSIKNYTFDDNAIYCEVSDQFNKNYILQITYNDNGRKGNMIVYNFINQKQLNKNLYRYNLDGYIIKVLELLRMLFLVGITYLTFQNFIKHKLLKLSNQ